MGELTEFVKDAGDSLECGEVERGYPGWSERGESGCGCGWRVRVGRRQTWRCVIGRLGRDGAGFGPCWHRR